MKPTPKQLANLKPCKKGEHPPGAGRTKGSLNINNRLERILLTEIARGKNKGKLGIDAILESAVRRAQRGDHRWGQYILDRLEPAALALRTALGVQVNVNAVTQTDRDAADFGRLVAAVQSRDLVEAARLLGVDLAPVKTIDVTPVRSGDYAKARGDEGEENPKKPGGAGEGR